MQTSDIPYKFAEIWAAGASGSFITNPIPHTTTAPAASQDLGFPPETANITGTPPNINDFNGMMYYVTAWARWQQSGAAIPYDATFQTNIGGYPSGAVVASATVFGKRWISVTDNNTTNPDSSGAGWFEIAESVVFLTASGSFTVPAWISKIPMIGTGGGAGGAGNGNGQVGGGGGAGGTAMGCYAVTPGSPYSFVIGAGGAGAASTTGNSSGGNGGATSFSTFFTANGGTGGVNNTGGLVAGGAGGTATGGATGGNFTGGWGADGYGASNLVPTGRGGGSYWGDGGPCGVQGGDQNALTYGSGGGGGYGPLSSDGGAGAPGVIQLRLGP
jgi:hypothetical protein